MRRDNALAGHLVCWLLITLGVFVLPADARTAEAGAKLATKGKPNIVVLIVDDWGWTDLGHRNPVLETPNIDQLAQEGLDFQQAYTVSPTCSPSRASILTGQYPARFQLLRHVPSGHKELRFDDSGTTGEEFHYWEVDELDEHTPYILSRNWMPLEVTTYAEALRTLGYSNFFVGKWHLGHEPYYPAKQGFDKEVGVTNFGLPDFYYPPYFRYGTPFPEEKTRYLTDKLTDEAVRIIETHDRHKPFSLTLSYHAVHAPYKGRKDLVRHFEDKGLKGDMVHHAAMVKAVDESVGRVRQALRKKGIEETTLVFLLSDQGSGFTGAELRGGKNGDSLYEGGKRIPFIVSWPGVTAPGRNNSIVASTDVFPTLVEVAGGKVENFKDLDGVSLLPMIRENRTVQRDKPVYAYTGYNNLYGAVRVRDWDLLVYHDGSVKLYNLSSDMSEKHEIGGDNPEVVKELAGKFFAWEKERGLDQYSGVPLQLR